MKFNGIDFNWVQDAADKKRLVALWRLAFAEEKENNKSGKNNNQALNDFKKAYREIREKQIVTRKEAFDNAHKKLNREITSFGNLINLD